jgi:hypothetical protein
MKKKSTITAVAGLLLVATFVGSSFSGGKKDEYKTACVADTSMGIPVFVRAMPDNTFDEVDKVKPRLIKKSGESENVQEKIIKLVNDAKVQKVAFDAVMIDNLNKAVLVKYKTNTAGKAIGKAQVVDDKDVFVFSTPAGEYTLGEEIEINNFGLGQMNNTGDELERMVNGIIEKAKKKVKKGEIKEFDGIFIGNGSNKTFKSSGYVLRYKK